MAPKHLSASSLSGTGHLTESCCVMRRLLRSTLTPSGGPAHLFRLAGRAIFRILQNPFIRQACSVHTCGQVWVFGGNWSRPGGGQMVLQGRGCCRHNCQIRICVRTPYPVSALMEEDFTQEWD